MKVFIVFDYYVHEGCSEPLKVFTTQADAENYIKTNSSYSGCWKELEVE